MVFLINFNIIWATHNIGMEKLTCKERHKALQEKYIKFIAAQIPATSAFVTCSSSSSLGVTYFFTGP